MSDNPQGDRDAKKRALAEIFGTDTSHVNDASADRLMVVESGPAD